MKSLAFWLVAPSLYVVAKVAGPWAAAAWTVAIGILVVRGGPRLVAAVRGAARAKLLLAGVAALLLLALAFGLVFPAVDAGLVGGGSDRDDALDLAAGRLLRGEYPYSERTYLGNAVSPFPGAVLLAAPFVLVATSALQSLFWLPAGALALGSAVEPPGAAVAWAAALLLLAPESLRELLAGGDLLANGLYVGTFAMLLLRPASSSPGLTLPVLWAVLLGVALSSRAHLLLALPVLARALALRRGGKGLALAAISLAACAAVTLPFALARPDEFSPLHTLRKLEPSGSLFPGQGAVVVLLGLALAAGLAVRLRSAEPGPVLTAAAWGVAAPVLLTAAISSVAGGRADLATLTALLPATVLATMGAWLGLFSAAPDRPSVAPAETIGERAA